MTMTRTEIVALACTDASGMPTLVTYKVMVDDHDYEMGYHYDRAIELAKDDRYEAPFVPFDRAEHDDLFRGVAELSHMLAQEEL